jgi:predicted DNA-binding protein (MmcQ/YjbR family)
MDLDALLGHCLAKPGATASHPFGPGALVVKVAGKMFAIIEEDADPLRLSLKSEPEIAVVLRESYASVAPGYHLNKRHWNTVTLDGRTVQGEQVLEWVDDSLRSRRGGAFPGDFATRSILGGSVRTS